MASQYTIGQGFNPEGQAKLIVKGFGLGLLKPKFYNVKVNDSEVEQKEIGELNKKESKFGLPVFDTLDFDSLQYTDLDGKIYSLTGTFTLGTVLIDVSQSKNIVTTAIQGRNGTIKEYISDGDYQINIKGVLVGDGIDVKPQDLKRTLIAYCKAPLEFGVASGMLEDFGIYTIVIKDYSFPQVEGQRNTVPFELTCLSDSPIELKSQSLS